MSFVTEINTFIDIIDKDIVFRIDSKQCIDECLNRISVKNGYRVYSTGDAAYLVNENTKHVKHTKKLVVKNRSK